MKLQNYNLKQNENEIRGFPTFSRSEKVGTSHKPSCLHDGPSKQITNFL